jgi:alpha-D-ribose 1-methylphosphonate 5-triphosphate diphosphatase PhnM
LKGGFELVDGGHRGEISAGCGAGLIQVRDYDRLRACRRVFLENERG